MRQRIIQVDTFTKIPFTGNPAAVCILQHAAAESWMQSVAREINVSETAFLFPESGGFNLRWFGPVMEVDICGHATLASAHVLWEDGEIDKDDKIHFYCRPGMLTAVKDGDWINLDLPVEPPVEKQVDPRLVDALSTMPLYVGANRFDMIIEVDSEHVLRDLKPDFRKLSDYSQLGLMVTSRSEAKEYDYVSRFFAPSRGVNEDPVTGSSHCCLAPYWQKKLDKSNFLAYQASARGGVTRVRLGDKHVTIGGQALTVMKGELIF